MHEILKDMEINYNIKQQPQQYVFDANEINPH